MPLIFSGKPTLARSFRTPPAVSWLMPVFILSDTLQFPAPQFARPDGLLAVGGDLSVERLLIAYRMGIFPWYNATEPILWWSPDPRLIMVPGEINISKSLKKLLRRDQFAVTMDTAFAQVIRACARVRRLKNEGTWLGRDMITAYERLHAGGYAHSVETWFEGKLAGGLYGVSLGGCFFGESMFTLVNNASKVALVALTAHLSALGFNLIDCQVATGHLMRMGAREIPRPQFLKRLDAALQVPTRKGNWRYGSQLHLLQHRSG